MNIIPQKSIRIIDRQIKLLYSPSAFLQKPTIDDIKKHKAYFNTVSYKDKTLFLSLEGIEALKVLSSTLWTIPSIKSITSKQELNEHVRSCHEKWLNKDLEPDCTDFVDDLLNALSQLIKTYKYLAVIEGIDLKGQSSLVIGPVIIQKSEPAILENIHFAGYLNKDSVLDQLKGELWLIGTSRGSPKNAEKLFGFRVKLAVGILAIYGSALYKGSIWRSRINVKTSPFEHRLSANVLRWEGTGENPTMSKSWGHWQDIPFDTETVAYLKRECYFNEIAELFVIEKPNELQSAIINSIYWFSDAYKDSTPAMVLVKLWSCAECFFSIDFLKISESNAKGIATVLAFAGYGVITPDEYLDLKRNVKRLYKLRSDAVHRAKFEHITISDISEMSHWIAWLIISMVSLSVRGYNTLNKIKEQAERLDNIYCNRPDYK